jgi:hypothetical protein
MQVPDRKKWQALKAAAKPPVPDKVSTFKLGELLNAYHAGVKKSPLDGVKPLTALAKGVKTYKADLKKKAPGFLATFKKSVEDPVLKEVDLYEQMGNPIAQLKGWVPKLTKMIGKIKDDTAILIRCVGSFHFVEQAADKLVSLDKANNDWMISSLTDISKNINTDPATLVDPCARGNFVEEIEGAMNAFTSQLRLRHMYR